MTQETFKNEKEIRRFLLGEMAEEERSAFEDRFIAEDSGLFEELGVVEDELIEAYVRETLSPAEKTKFERSFLTTETRRRRVAFTREMIDRLIAENRPAVKKTEPVTAENSVWNLLAGLFKRPSLAFGAGFAALLILLVFGLWFLIGGNRGGGGEIVKHATPTPVAPTPTPVKNENGAGPANETVVNAAPNRNEASRPPANVNAENINKPVPKETPPRAVTATLALFAPTIRGEGRTSELKLTNETTGANFELHLESQDYKTYRAELVDADGRTIYRSGKINARNSRLGVFFPAAKLKKGDYFVKVYGFNAAGGEESAADFQFRVTRQ
ncbi:MAG: hypothetical protein JSS81_06220 [Acidobacteria bacterium]|nr:hypothetical protein [Acidobacteriota bacterium]